jgi:tetratricopeptide (TPR) repeat protein
MLLATGTLGCAAKRPSSLETTEEEILAGKEEGDLETIVEAGDRRWAGRSDAEDLSRAIELYERATEVDASDLPESKRRRLLADLYVRLARAYFFKANAHVDRSDRPEDEREAEAMELFEKSLSAAERGIVLADSDLAEAVSGGASLAERVDSADPDAIPALYWYATVLGKWGMTKGYSTILEYQSDIQKTMQFVCRERPEYYHGGCHRYFGAYWTRVPFGKSAEKSRRHLQQAIEIAPYFLGNKVLMAEYYAVLADKRQLYERLLREVIEAPTEPADHPEVAPENRFHQQRARELLKRADEAFQ